MRWWCNSSWLNLHCVTHHVLPGCSSSGDHKQKFYWGHKEILVPVYKNMSDAMKKHPDVDVLISFASLRSAFDSTMETLQYPQVNTSLYHLEAKKYSHGLQTLTVSFQLLPDSHHCHHRWGHPRSPYQEDHQESRWEGRHDHRTSNRKFRLNFHQSAQDFSSVFSPLSKPLFIFRLGESSLAVSKSGTQGACWITSLHPNSIVQAAWPMCPARAACPTNSTTSSPAPLMVFLKAWRSAATGTWLSPPAGGAGACVFESVCNSGLFHRYPGSVFTDHVLRYQDTPGVKMIVVLGEVRQESTHAAGQCFRQLLIFHFCFIKYLLLPSTDRRHRGVQDLPRY